MYIFKNLFLFKKKSLIDNKVNDGLVDQYGEIAKLVKEARIQKKYYNSRIVTYFKNS